jgi:hypothetical protein
LHGTVWYVTWKGRLGLTWKVRIEAFRAYIDKRGDLNFSLKLLSYCYPLSVKLSARVEDVSVHGNFHMASISRVKEVTDRH